MNIRELIEKIALRKDCIVHTPKGLPKVGKNYSLPEDLIEFYTLCGGIDLYTDADFPYSVVPPDKFLPATMVICGNDSDFLKTVTNGDPSHHFFTIVEDDNGDYIAMDLDEDRLGFCYDAFHENYGSPGDMPIIALDFTELLNNLFKNEGKDIFWLESGYPTYGDAYDNKK